MRIPTDPHGTVTIPLNRRGFLSRLAMSAVAGMMASACAPAGGQPVRRRLLCFTKSSGWEHDTVKRGADGSPSLVERVISRLGEENGFEVTCTKDGRVFTEEGVADFDAFFFYTSGDLTQPGTDGQPPMSAGGKETLLAAVRGAKGFVGIHSASDTFHSQPDPSDARNRHRLQEMVVDPFIVMLGGEFLSHGEPQTAPMRIIDPAFPGMAGFGTGTVERFGEWYSLVNLNPDMHVLAVLETEGMQGLDYRRAPFPVIWARQHGDGRVFYSALGHFPEEWEDPAFLGTLVGSLRWAFGDVEASLTRNLEQVAPRYMEVPPSA
jgi:uncharacterized protein